MPEPLTIAATVALTYLVKFAEREAMGTVSDKLKKRPRELSQSEPVKKAVEKTLEAFPSLKKHDLRFVMQMWCNSEKFERVYSAHKNDPHSVSDELILTGFRDTATGYNTSGEVEKLASEVLTTFFHALHDALLQSPKEGLAFHDALEGQRAYALQAKLDEVQASIEVLTANNAKLVETNALLTMRLVAPAADSQGGTANSPDTKWKDQIDFALQLSESEETDEIFAARAIVKKIRQAIEWGNLSASTRARVATLAAKCADATGDLKTMKIEVEAALELQPDDVNCLSNASGVALVTGDLKRAEELARTTLEKAPRNENAGLVLVQAWDHDDSEGMEKFINENAWLLGFPNTCAALAHVRAREGRHRDAIELAKRALKLDRNCIEALEALSDAQFIAVREGVWRGEKWGLDADARRGLRRAESAVNRAITLLARGPNQVKLHRSLSRRATIRNARGCFTEALQDCDRILLNNPTPENQDFATLDKANILIHSGRGAEAAPLFEQLQDPDLRRQSAASQAFSYQHAGRFEDAIKILEGIWNPEKPESEPGVESQWLIAETLSSLYRECGREAEAEATIVRLARARPDSPNTIALLAQKHYETGDVGSALSLLTQKAVECRESGNRPAHIHLLLRIADLSYRAKLFKEAVLAWKEAGWQSLAPTHRLAYLNALYQTGQLAEALEVARYIKAENGFAPRAVEIEAAICAYMGEHKLACSLWEELSLQEPQNTLHTINRAQCALQSGDQDEAMKALAQVTYQSIKDDAISLRRVSAMQSAIGLKEAIRFAYRARQVDFGNADSHSNYVRVYFQSTTTHSYGPDGTYSEHRAADVLGLNSPEPGTVPCTIHLQPVDKNDGKEQRSITILEEGPFDRTHDIYDAEDEFARRLLNYVKSPEGTFSIRQSPGGPTREYRVIPGPPYYVHAFQESSLRGAEWFGEEAGAWSGNLEDGLEEFFAMIEDRGKGFDEVMQYYTQWNWPLSTVASACGRSVFDLWFLVSQHPEWGVHAERGITPTFDKTVEKLGEHFDLARSSNTPNQKPILVLESSSLLSLVYFDCVDLISPHFRLLVPDSLRRRIKSESARLHAPHIPQGVFEELIAFVDNHTECLPARSVIEFPPEKISEWRRCMGQEQLDSFLLAKEYKALMLSEDAVLRELSHFQPAVDSVNTQHILLFLEQRGLLPQETRHECLERMAQKNFKHLLLSAHFYLWLLEKHEGMPNATVRAAFRYLEAPMCNDESAIKIVAAVLAKQSSSRSQHYPALLDLCILVLVTGRPIQFTLTQLQLALNHPHYKLEREAILVLALYIQIWKIRLGKGG